MSHNETLVTFAQGLRNRGVHINLDLVSIGYRLDCSGRCFLADLFETRVRYSGISFGYQMAGMLGGAPAPFVCTALVRWGRGASWSCHLSRCGVACQLRSCLLRCITEVGQVSCPIAPDVERYGVSSSF